MNEFEKQKIINIDSDFIEKLKNIFNLNIISIDIIKDIEDNDFYSNDVIIKIQDNNKIDKYICTYGYNIHEEKYNNYKNNFITIYSFNFGYKLFDIIYYLKKHI